MTTFDLLSTSLTLQTGYALNTAPGAPNTVRTIDGWFEGPPVRAGAGTARLNQHGQFSQRGFRDSRLITVTVHHHATSRVAALQMIDQLNAYLADGQSGIFAVDDRELGTRYCRVSLSGTPSVAWDGVHGDFDYTYELLAADPRKYGADISIHEARPPIQPGGLRYDLFGSIGVGEEEAEDDSPGVLDFGLPSFEGIATVQNTGTAESAVQFQIRGPALGFLITEIAMDGEGRRIESSMEIAPGSYLDIDTATGLVTLDGVADRSASLSVAQFGPGLMGGEVRTYQFDSNHVDARLTVKVVPAWW